MSEDNFRVEKGAENQPVNEAQNNGGKIIDEAAYRIHAPREKGPTAVGRGGDPLFRRISATKEQLLELMEETQTVQDWVQRETSNNVALACLDNENLKEIYYAFSKKLSMNYDVLSKFIDENKTKITEVIVLGHSMLGVDEPYYRDVIVPKLKDVHWDVYWHKFDDASIFIEKYKLPEAKSKEW